MMGRFALILALGTMYFSVSAYAEHGKDPLRVIADTDTPVPGGGGNTFQTFFQLDGVDPDISGRNIVFGGCCPAGFYRWFDGELGVIADVNSTFPGSGNPLGFGGATGSSPSISGKNVAFACSNGQPGPGAICASINGKLQSVAEGGVTFVPGTGESFGTFFALNGVGPSISGTNVAFSAGSDSFNGVYARIDGEIVTIADNTTPVPGQPGLTFQNFGQLNGFSPSISGANVAFFGFWFGGVGVYAHINGELRAIVDTTTGAKVGADPSISGENVAFLSGGIGGISCYIDGQLQVTVDTNTPVPEGTGTFCGFSIPVIDGENLGFAACTDIGAGIFTYIDGEVELIANRNTIVPGHEDTTFESFGGNCDVTPSFSDVNLVFYGKGRLPGKNNKSINGIYAHIHEPPIPAASTWALVAMSLLLLSGGSILLRKRTETG
jgi:hypothetical protein